MKELQQAVLDYLQKHRQEYKDALRELAQIPAPSGKEELRAQWCKAYLEKLGAQGVYIDKALNVVFPYYAQDCNQLTVVNAHTDVVFPDEEPLPFKEENGRYCAPGVGDDTANVIAVLQMAGMAISLGLKPKKGILFVLNSGEEGLGNLKGARQLMEDYKGRIAQWFAIDGGYHEFVTKAVGSKRYKITVETEGGHSYGSFGNRNAIYYMAKMIDTFYSLKAPVYGKTTYNVGIIQGGTSVNTIAQSCSMLFEYRSDDIRGLDFMDQFFENVTATYRSMGISVIAEKVGDRPCMAQGVNQQPLIQLIQQAGALHGLSLKEESGSTDCNIPLSMGIPAVCFGVYEGHGAHTREEWLDIESTVVGMRFLAQVIMSLMEE